MLRMFSADVHTLLSLKLKIIKIEKTEAIKNKNIDQMSSAGISTAQLMARKKY